VRVSECRFGFVFVCLLVLVPCATALVYADAWDSAWPDPDDQQEKMDRVTDAISNLKQQGQDKIDAGDVIEGKGLKDYGCRAQAKWDQMGGEGIVPTCASVSHTIPGNLHAPIRLTKERICGSQADLQSTLIHELYHHEWWRIRREFCKRGRQHRRYGSHAAGSQERLEAEMLYLLYQAIRAVDEAAANITQVYEGCLLTPPPPHKPSRKRVACRKLLIAKGLRDRICDLLTEYDEKFGSGGPVPSAHR